MTVTTYGCVQPLCPTAISCMSMRSLYPTVTYDRYIRIAARLRDVQGVPLGEQPLGQLFGRVARSSSLRQRQGIVYTRYRQRLHVHFFSVTVIVLVRFMCLYAHVYIPGYVFYV